MKTYYVAGIPYSDELWHSGTKGMKWGRRLYQNPDGTLTPLGKIHYGVKSGTKMVGKHVIQSFKRKHPWMMTDKELTEDMARLQKEKALKDLRMSSKTKGVVGKLLGKVGDVTYSTAKSFGTKFGETMGQKIVNHILDRKFESSDIKESRRLEEKSKLIDSKIKLMKSREGRANARLEKQMGSFKREKIKNDRVAESLKSKKTKTDAALELIKSRDALKLYKERRR